MHVESFVFSYFIKLGTLFAILKIPPAIGTNGNQHQFQNKTLLAIMPRRAEITTTPFD